MLLWSDLLLMRPPQRLSEGQKVYKAHLSRGKGVQRLRVKRKESTGGIPSQMKMPPKDHPPRM
jgi:hypothetical protein